MRVVPRGRRPIALLVMAVALGPLAAGCGGSVADADAPRPVAPQVETSSPFCAAVEANTAAVRPLNGLTARGSVPAEQLTTTVDAARRAGNDLVAAAPAEVRDDAQRTIDALNLQLDALIAAGGDPVAAGRQPGLAAALAAPDLAAANRALGAYVDDNC